MGVREDLREVREAIEEFEANFDPWSKDPEVALMRDVLSYREEQLLKRSRKRVMRKIHRD